MRLNPGIIWVFDSPLSELRAKNNPYPIPRNGQAVCLLNSFSLSNLGQTNAGLLAIRSLTEGFGRKGHIDSNTEAARSQRKGKSMNRDQLKGKWIQFKGDIKQQWGKFTDDDVQQIEGSLDKILGMLQERNVGNRPSVAQKWYSDKMGELLEWAGKLRQRSQPEATKG